MFDNDNEFDSARAAYADMTTGYSENEKTAYNEGFVQASAEAIKAFRAILDDEDISSEEKLEALSNFLDLASVPIMLISLATGKDYLA